MLTVPVLGASQSIVLRQLREMNEYTVGSYMSFAMVLIYGPIVLFSQTDGLSYLSNFETLDWVIVIGLGFTSTLVQLCRTKASQYEEPAKLAVCNYFQSVFQLFFDLLFFNTMFGVYQVIGIAIVLGASSVKWGYGIKNNFFSKKVKKGDGKGQDTKV
jgi:drug/metabolite transporter (DMT)-like permease